MNLRDNFRNDDSPPGNFPCLTWACNDERLVFTSDRSIAEVGLIGHLMPPPPVESDSVDDALVPQDCSPTDDPDDSFLLEAASIDIPEGGREAESQGRRFR